MKNKWEVVIYHKGKRMIRPVPDAKTGTPLVNALKERGYAAHLVSRHKAFAPKQDEGPPGTWWCPYCRRWREFRIPRGDEDAEVGTHGWYLAAFSRMELKVCPWCGMTENDFYVKSFNSLWGLETRRRRSKKTGRRHRIRRS